VSVGTGVAVGGNGVGVGDSVGTFVGTAVGTFVGTFVGIAVGTFVGTFVGTAVGTLVGTAVGTLVGTGVGVGPQYVQSLDMLQVLPHSTSVNKPELIIGAVPPCRQCCLLVPGNKLIDCSVPLQFVIV
jgi:hypothetical protein